MALFAAAAGGFLVGKALSGMGGRASDPPPQNEVELALSEVMTVTQGVMQEHFQATNVNQTIRIRCHVSDELEIALRNSELCKRCGRDNPTSEFVEQCAGVCTGCVVSGVNQSNVLIVKQHVELDSKQLNSLVESAQTKISQLSEDNSSAVANLFGRAKSRGGNLATLREFFTESVDTNVIQTFANALFESQNVDISLDGGGFVHGLTQEIANHILGTAIAKNWQDNGMAVSATNEVTQEDKKGDASGFTGIIIIVVIVLVVAVALFISWKLAAAKRKAQRKALETVVN